MQHHITTGKCRTAPLPLGVLHCLSANVPFPPNLTAIQQGRMDDVAITSHLPISGEKRVIFGVSFMNLLERFFRVHLQTRRRGSADDVLGA